MAILIDIVGSLVIAGIIFLTILGLNVNMNQATYNKTFSVITQSNAIALARMIEYDFVKMGYHSPKPMILSAGADSISFVADLANDGTVHTVKYRLGSTSTLASTKNPNDRLLYRVQDGATIPMNLGVISFSLSYVDSAGFKTTKADSIRGITVAFNVQSSEPVDTGYVAAYWQKIFYPKNLK